MISIKFAFDELPADPGDVCGTCKQPIIEIKHMPYIQVGDIQEVIYMKPLCKFCYEGFKDEPGETS